MSLRSLFIKSTTNIYNNIKIKHLSNFISFNLSRKMSTLSHEISTATITSTNATSTSTNTLKSDTLMSLSPNSLIKYKIDRYKCIWIDELTNTSILTLEYLNLWSSELGDIINKYKLTYKAIWIKIPINRSELISYAVKNNFIFHHATSNYIQLSLWLSNKTNNLPSYATSSSGVGAFVINDKKEILMVLEKYTPNVNNFWKLPGGTVDMAEDLKDAIEREVLEETNIKATFSSIIAFRHMTEFRFNHDDYYYICILRAEGKNGLIQPIPQPDEIVDVKWFPLKEALEMKHQSHFFPNLANAVEHEATRLLENNNLPPIGLQRTEIQNINKTATHRLYVAMPPKL